MTVKRIRRELDALRDHLNKPASSVEISALTDINVRLDRLAARQTEVAEQPSAAEMAELAPWLQQWREQRL